MECKDKNYYIIDGIKVITYFSDDEEEEEEEIIFITKPDSDIIKNLCNINIQIVSYLKEIREILDIELLKYNFYYKIDNYFYKTNNTNITNNIYS